MANAVIPLMACLIRQAGFGAPTQEREARAAKRYEPTVEELLDPDAQESPIQRRALVLIESWR
jgi:hypothetical protein